MFKPAFIRTFAIAAMGASLLFGFNNCSDVAFQTSPSVIEAERVELNSTSSLLINDGAQYTNNKQVHLRLNSPRAVEMKISVQSDCSDGTWEKYSSGRPFDLQQANGQARAFAQFKDLRGSVSACVNDDIIHDDVPPEAKILNAAGFMTRANNIAIETRVNDAVSGVAETICKNPSGQAINCSLFNDLTGLSEGTNLVSIKARDHAGNESAEAVYTFLVDRTPPVVTFNLRPPTLSGSASARIEFSANDNGSGVDKYYCRLDSAAFQICTSPVNLNGLADGAHKFEVYALDVVGNQSQTVNTTWTVDLTAPVVEFTQVPAPISNSTSAVFAFMGSDNGQPITIFECRRDGANFAACSTPHNLSNLVEGSHTFEVRGRDAAGNYSAPIQYQWLIDLTPPTISITQGPPPYTNQVNAVFAWMAADTSSGVKLVECKIDSGAYTACPATGQTFNGLAEGAHTMTVRVTDGAGNQATASRSWTIDLTPPSVQITQGPQPYVNTLTAQFSFVGNDNIGVANYECRLDAGNYQPCSSPHQYQSLMDGGHSFLVRAIDRAGNVSVPASHSWNIDRTPPLIRVISAPATFKEGEMANIQYEVVDVGSGLQLVRCGLMNGLADCPAIATRPVGPLMMGAYSYQIVATDKVGNQAVETISFTVTSRPAVCDPFSPVTSNLCNGGLIGDIFYLDSNHIGLFQGMSGKTVEYFYNYGIKVDALLNLSSVNVPTRAFDQGFPVSGGGLILNNAGQPLFEYFAFRLKTVFKLDPVVDQPGWYQFATISDDGSMLNYKPNPMDANYSTLIANDGDHSTRMVCASQAIYIDDVSRIPMEFKYYQGPRTEIALTVAWRKVDSISPPADSRCGFTSNSAWGPNGSALNDILARGWRIPGATNYIAPPQ